MDCSLPGSSVHGIFQARVLEWIAISFSRGSSQPRDWTQVSCIVDRRFTVWATREEIYSLSHSVVPSITLQWSLGKAFLSFCPILWNSAFKWVYLFFSPCLSFLFFSQLFVKPPQTIILPFYISFSWGFFFEGRILLIPAFMYNVLNLHPYFFRYSIRSNPLNLFVTSTV